MATNIIISGIMQLVPCVLVAYIVAKFVRRYFIITSGNRKTNMPFLPKYNLLTGSKEIIFDPKKILGVKAHEWHEKLGDNFGCYFGKDMQIFTRDLDIIYKIYVSDFHKHRNRYYVNSLSDYFKYSLLEARDQAWQTSRKAVGSVLKSTKLKIDSVETDIDRLISRLFIRLDERLKEAQLQGKEPDMDMLQVHKNFFMSSILKIIYNQGELVNFASERNDVVEEMYNFINVNYETVASYCFLIPPLAELVRPMLKFLDHGKYLGLLTDRLKLIIKETAAKGEVSGTDLRTIHSLIKSFRKGELTETQLVGNSVYLMMAGFATSVDTMTSLFWELAQHQDVQDKLRAELKQYGDQSPFLDQCLNETLRLYPGANTNRELTEHVDHNGLRYVKGSCLNISIYSIHRDKKVWGSDADEWKPERFAPDKVKKHHPAQFLPFGIGPRWCVGYHLARLELIKFSAAFLLRYKVEPCKLTQSELEIIPLGALPFALPLKGPVYLKVSPAAG